MRIATITPYLHTTGGISDYVHGLGRALSELGCDITYVAADSFPRPRSRAGVAKSTAVALRQAKPDIVHCHGPWYMLLPGVAYVTARRRRIPVLFTEHTWPRASDRRQRWALAPSLPLTTQVICLSHAAAAHFQRITPGANRARINVIYPGTTLPETNFRGPAVDVVGSMLFGLEEKWRGACDFVSIVERLAERDARNLTSVLVGGHPTQPDRDAALKVRARSIGNGTNLRLVGITPAGPYLACSRVLLHPSYRDNVPQTVLQALALGLRVVAYDVGSLAEIAHGRPLTLVPPGDINAAAAAVAAALAGDDCSPIERPRVPASELTWTRCAEKHLAVYNGLRGLG
jgi:glycosyltransferase involved in cell wall biosynthesis